MNPLSQPGRAASATAPRTLVHPVVLGEVAARPRAATLVTVASVVCGHDPMRGAEARGRCRDVVPELIIELL